MKSIKFLLVFFTLGLSLFSCKNSEDPEVISVGTAMDPNTEKALDPNAKYAKAEFGIEGMTCAIGCAKTIEKKLAKMDGVKSAKVDFDHQIAMVEYNENMVTANSLKETVASAGEAYKVTEIKNVEAFSTLRMCEMECCKGKTAGEKANCEMECCKA